MMEQPSEALRLALNEIDRLRARCLWMTRFLLVWSIGFLCGSMAMFLLRGNVAMGTVCGLISLWSLIGAVGINQSGTSYANTLRTLRAIAALSQERSQQRPHS